MQMKTQRENMQYNLNLSQSHLLSAVQSGENKPPQAHHSNKLDILQSKSR